uniref:Transporter n=1 Tax=Cynoglossus semilaevis TaxID=244447 RepID=A0A3P8UYE7_CYNSE
MSHSDENAERGNWTSKYDYLLSLVGYAVGLGNIWRFPYLSYKNGGGAFIIPYLLSLILCAIPVIFLETAMGQFCSQGPVNMWRAVPLLQGVGLAIVVLNTVVALYYNALVAYALYYMFASMQSPLPWSSCLSWADSNCRNSPLVFCNISGNLVANWTHDNITCPSSNVIKVPMPSPSEQYWNRVVLQRSSSLDETGHVVWHLALCLLLSCMIIAAVLIKGIKSSGKAVYFTSTFPYVLLLILIIRSAMLEGSGDGIAYYIGAKSNLTKLTEAQVWGDAVTQTFFSLSIGCGGIVTLASYNNFHNNIIKDSCFCGTSIFAGFAIFGLLGHMAHLYGQPIEAVVEEGFAMAFIVYPAGLTKLPGSSFFSFLFFLMLSLIGLDTQFINIEVLVTILCDSYPNVLKSRRGFVTFGICSLLFLLGLPCVTQAGIYWVHLLDKFAGSWLILIMVLSELIGFCYIYGVKNLIADIEMMIGKKSSTYWLIWKCSWLIITPVIAVLLWSLISVTRPVYGEVLYPDWGTAMGWCVVAFVLIPIPGAIQVKALTSPSEDWHPYLDIHCVDRYSKEIGTKQTCHHLSICSGLTSLCWSKH